MVAPDRRPLERVMGPELGDLIRRTHEAKASSSTWAGLMRGRARRGRARQRRAAAGRSLLAGIGVRPNLELAEAAGLALDRGASGGERLETSAPGSSAAGNIARWPDPHTGDAIRVEHWVVAERQGQTAARNMLGMGEPFDAVPFFWSQHYGVAINYVGHGSGGTASRSGRSRREGLRRAVPSRGTLLALATLGRDQASLAAELAMERESHRAVRVPT